MTFRSQKKKAVEQLISGGEFETSEAGNETVETQIAGTSKSPKLHSGNIDEINTSLRKAILSGLKKYWLKSKIRW